MLRRVVASTIQAVYPTAGGGRCHHCQYNIMWSNTSGIREPNGGKYNILDSLIYHSGIETLGDGLQTLL